MASRGTEPHPQRALLLALLGALLLWNLPFGGLLLYPFKLMATWLHETSHGLTMLFTGAGFDHLEIFRDTSGIAYARHGVGRTARALIASAGYMGTASIGALLLVLGQTRRAARGVLLGLAMAMATSALLWVQNDFGLLAVSTGATACTLVAIFPGARLATLLVNFVAAQSCINAVLDIRVLFRPNLVINGQSMGGSDAHNMAMASFGPPWFWAGVWMAWSFAMFYLALRVLHLRERHPGLPWRALLRPRQAAAAGATRTAGGARPGKAP